MAFLPSRTSGRLVRALALSAALALLASCAGLGLQQDAEVAKAHYARHLTFRSQNQLNKAALELELAIKADPQMYHAYYQLGLIYQSLGQPEKARLAWEKGLAEARSGPERSDYPKTKSMAEMETALAGLEPPPLPMPSYAAPPARPPAKTKARVQSLAKSYRTAAAHGTGYAVLVSSNLTKAGAASDVHKLSAHGYKASVTTYKDKRGKVWHRVWVGCCTSQEKARHLAATLKKKGLAHSPAVLRR